MLAIFAPHKPPTAWTCYWKRETRKGGGKRSMSMWPTLQSSPKDAFDPCGTSG